MYILFIISTISYYSTFRITKQPFDLNAGFGCRYTSNKNIQQIKKMGWLIKDCTQCSIVTISFPFEINIYVCDLNTEWNNDKTIPQLHSHHDGHLLLCPEIVHVFINHTITKDQSLPSLRTVNISWKGASKCCSRIVHLPYWKVSH